MWFLAVIHASHFHVSVLRHYKQCFPIGITYKCVCCMCVCVCVCSNCFHCVVWAKALLVVGLPGLPVDQKRKEKRCGGREGEGGECVREGGREGGREKGGRKKEKMNWEGGSREIKEELKDWSVCLYMFSLFVEFWTQGAEGFQDNQIRS